MLNIGRLIERKDLRDKTYVFNDRVDAGRALAEMLFTYKGTETFVLAIAAGGVPVAAEVAKALGLKLRAVIAGKIQIPYNPEAGFGAIAPDGTAVINEPLLARLGLSAKEVERQKKKALEKIRKRLELFGPVAEIPDLNGKTAILVDDGLASGYTMLASLRFIRKKDPKWLVVAVPTASERAVDFILPEVDEVYCLNIRGGFVFAVADAYRNWRDIPEEEALSLCLSGVD